MNQPSIAIIGAGLAGLTAATMLKDKATITVFEKARGVGGRMSTRYADPYYFDHGAPFFTARSRAFQAFLQPFIADGTVAEWKPSVTTLNHGNKPYKRDWFEPHYAACPNMNSLCKTLAEGLGVHTQTEITPLAGEGPPWVLQDKAGNSHGPFDWVICTAPAAQCSRLLPPSFAHHEALSQVSMTGCYSLLLGLQEAWPHHWQCAKVMDSPLRWVMVNSSKPGREAEPVSVMIQTTDAWAEARIDEDIPEMQNLLMEHVTALIGVREKDTSYLTTHRWRYAHTPQPLHSDTTNYQPEDDFFLADEALQLAICSDWCRGSSVEDAFLSSHSLMKYFNIFTQKQA